MIVPAPKARIACFVDGYNLYHAIDNLRDEKNNRFDHLKWLNLWSLAGAFITPTTQTLAGVYYFSAYAKWLPHAYGRHQIYTAALAACGVKVLMADFKNKDRQCKSCGAEWVQHEEKESDVHMAVEFVHQAHRGAFDKALLITSDSDICPAIRTVQTAFPRLQLQVLTPPNSYDLSRELRGTVPTVRIRMKHLYRNLLPAEMNGRDGVKLCRPEKYNPPAGMH